MNAARDNFWSNNNWLFSFSIRSVHSLLLFFSILFYPLFVQESFSFSVSVTHTQLLSFIFTFSICHLPIWVVCRWHEKSISHNQSINNIFSLVELNLYKNAAAVALLFGDGGGACGVLFCHVWVSAHIWTFVVSAKWRVWERKCDSCSISSPMCARWF